MKELYDENEVIVNGFVKEFLADEQKFKQTWAKQAKRQLAFANGDQRVDTATGASPIMVNSQPANYMYDNRQNVYQTNEIEPIVRTLTAYMCRARPTAECFPASWDDEEQKNVAKLAEMVHNAKYDIDNEYQNSRMSAFWSLSVGNVYAKDFWNPDKGPYGSNDTAILTPFSVSIDHSIVDFDKQPLIVESYMIDKDWAKEVFNQEGPGYTGKAAEIGEEAPDIGTLNTLEEIKYSLPYIGYQYPGNPKNKTLVNEIYIPPSRDWPKGRFIINCGGKTVFSSLRELGSPYYMPLEDEMWHPYTHFGFEPYVGRALFKSLVEQILPLQIRLNEINGAILENANTLAKPNIMAAVNQLKKGVLNGRGSNVYTYQVIPGAQPPFAFEGTPLPSQFFQEKKQLIDTMVRVAGTNFVMSGTPPTGVTAASAIQTLLENASSQLSDVMISWEKFHERRFTKKLRVIHKFMTHPDDKLTNYIKLLNKNMLEKQIKDFVGQTDLSDGIVLKIQYGSMIPKSELAKKDLYKEMAKEGLLGPITDPTPQGAKLREQMLERLGEKPFDSEEGVEVKKAKWENDRMMQGLPVEVSQYDIDAIHLPCHVGELQSPTFLEKASDEQKIAFDNHIQEHKAKQAQAMAAMQPPPGVVPEGGPEAPIPPELPPEAVPQGMTPA